jgi:hypothetical protein
MGQRLVPERNEQNSLTDNIIEVDTMLVRDYFAGLALSLFTVQVNYSDLAFGGSELQARIAKFCYGLADAMIVERSKRL